jgi:hypothetical protein
VFPSALRPTPSPPPEVPRASTFNLKRPVRITHGVPSQGHRLNRSVSASDFYHGEPPPATALRGQYILTTNEEHIPVGWARHSLGRWWLGVVGLDVVDLVDGGGRRLGVCVGYPVSHRAPEDNVLVLRAQEGSAEVDIEDFYRHVTGRYIVILTAPGRERLYLDPYGALTTVFSKNAPITASNPHLVGETPWDSDLIAVLDMPESGLWYPFGLTPKQGVRRLLPNHYLDLDTWTVARHWPISPSDLRVEQDWRHGVDTIIDTMERTFAVITARYPLQVTLTAGRDSRIVLACARKTLAEATFVTFAQRPTTVDMHIAEALRRRFKLRHEFLPVRAASQGDLYKYLYLTGHCVGGQIWKIHKTIEQFRPDCVAFSGTGGEVGRAYYWRDGDNEGTRILEEDLLRRCSMPLNAQLVDETACWLSELSPFNALTILDLFYLENRLGCWVAPQHLANTTTRFGFSPFNHRSIFAAMMRLPYEFRRRQELANAICRSCWPELLDYPFNQFTGLRKQVATSGKLVRRFGTATRRRIARWFQ